MWASMVHKWPVQKMIVKCFSCLLLAKARDMERDSFQLYLNLSHISALMYYSTCNKNDNTIPCETGFMGHTVCIQ
jgi:hypothetical protein